MGAWRTGVFDCFKDSIVPNCCMVTFCPPVSLAQICIRVNYSESYCGLLLLFVFPWFFAAITVALAVVPATSEWDTEPRQHLFLLPIAAGIVWFWQFAAVLTARRTVRKTFQIPEEECGEDVVLSLLCWPCVQAQVATHAKSYTPGSCSFARPDTLPPFQVY
jgi:Cys-rich protein (TIGR01571 family)